MYENGLHEELDAYLGSVEKTGQKRWAEMGRVFAEEQKS